MLPDTLVASSTQEGTPLILVTEEGYKAWLKKQSAFTTRWLEHQDYKPKPGQFIVLPSRDGGVDRVVACVSDPVSMWDLSAAARALPKGVYRLDMTLDEGDESKLALGWLLGGFYRDTYKKEKSPARAKLCTGRKDYLSEVKALAEAISDAREWITAPASDMGPKDLEQVARSVAQKNGAKLSVIVGDELLKHNYPAIHAVGRAGAQEPRLIDLQWGKSGHPLVVFVGKGVCFDTGGLDLKPSSSMYLMRKDMAGAAVALALAGLVMQMKLPVRLRVLVPAVENAVSEHAFRPSDILKMRDGTTVEVGNTDAEGRLVLADALSEAKTAHPDLLIDFSTLTGAARTAVGTGISAFFTPDDKLAEAFCEAGQHAEDPVWRLPLFDGYKSMLDTPFADINSCPSSPYAGAITAALFLGHFLSQTKRWVHLDFMGWNPAGKPGRPEGGEAMSLRAVYQWLKLRYAV